MDSEMEKQRKELQTGTLAERQRPRVTHICRDGQRQIGPAIQKEKEQRQMDWAIPCPAPPNHKGSTPSRRASAVCHVLPVSVELIILTEVFTAALSTISERYKLLQ